MSSVILPGSYDPITNGHLAVIREAAARFDEVYVVAFVNPEKSYTFSLEDRVAMMMLATDDIDNVMVSYSNGLVIDYMRDHDIELIVKGYRNDTDLEYENKMAEWNLKMGGYETRLIKCDPEYEGVSSTRARELIKDKKDIDKILPKKVAEFIKSR
jgi:pantetheine-phosphate adenylyltransferase